MNKTKKFHKKVKKISQIIIKVKLKLKNKWKKIYVHKEKKKN